MTRYQNDYLMAECNKSNTKPLVSIITIFLNAQQFIQAAIDSAIAQTYDNWELLLVDDGSTDDSTNIALHYAQQFPQKVLYLQHDEHQNRGMSASRNLGIRNAKGKYISFLDSDDIWLPNKLEHQIAIIESLPEAAGVCAPTKWWYSWTGNQADSRDFVQKLNVPLNTLVKPPTLLLLFLQDEWASLHDVLVKREVVESIGGYEDSFRAMYEDQAFHAKLCLASPLFVASQCWYWYRQHSNACTYVSHNIGQTYTAARQTFLNWLEEYLIKQELQATEVWKVLQKQLFPYRHPNLYRMSCRTRSIANRVKRLI